MFQDIQEIKKYVNVSVQLDMKLLEPYIEESLRVRIYPYVPKDVCELIVDETYYELLKKSVANYAVAYSIPFLKVHLSNVGGNNFTDGKMQKSSWWDLRDFGISAVGIADRALNNLLFELYNSNYKQQVTALQGNNIFAGVWEFEQHYGLGGSWEVFARLRPVIQRVWEIMIAPRVSICTLDELRPYPTIFNMLQTATAYFTVAEMIQLGSVSFTNEVMLIQWDELPWQQSKILSRQDLNHLYEEMNKRANSYLNQMISLIRFEQSQDPNALLCFVEKNTEREPIAKKSGLYL